MFFHLEVKGRNFNNPTILSRYFILDNTDKNENTVAIFEIKSGEKVFLIKKLEGKSFFLFPFENEFRECIFTETEEEGKLFDRGREAMRSNMVVPSKNRAGVLVLDGNIVYLSLFKGNQEVEFLIS